jgi:hypothetical protein
MGSLGFSREIGFRFSSLPIANRRNSQRRPTAGRDVYLAPNPPSPVRNRSTPTANTPRNRVNFLAYARMCWRSLCLRRLGGGGGSPGRTRLSGRIAVRHGKYREVLRLSRCRRSHSNPYRGGGSLSRFIRGRGPRSIFTCRRAVRGEQVPSWGIGVRIRPQSRALESVAARSTGWLRSLPREA